MPEHKVLVYFSNASFKIMNEKIIFKLAKLGCTKRIESTMDSSLTDLIDTVSKSKEQAQDVFYRTISRQTLNTVWNETYKTNEGDKNYSKKVSNKAQKLHDKHHCRVDESMKTRLDDTMKKILDHMCQISLECKCFYDASPKKTLSQAERKHFDAYHKNAKKKKRIKKKGATKSSSSGDESDSSAVTETITSSGLQDNENKTSSKQVEFLVDDIDLQPPPNLILRAKDSLKLVQKKSHSRSDFLPNSNSSYKSAFEKFSNTPDYPITLSSKPLCPASDTSQFNSSSSDENSSSEQKESSSSPAKKGCLKKNTTQNAWAEYIGRTDTYKNHRFVSHAHESETSDRGMSSWISNGISAAAVEEVKSKLNPHNNLKKSSCGKAQNKQRTLGSFLDADTYVQGHGFDRQDETLNKFPLNGKETSQQGICIITKPGQYIVRKPSYSSNKHFFHVEPGKFINLNISDLDAC